MLNTRFSHHRRLSRMGMRAANSAVSCQKRIYCDSRWLWYGPCYDLSSPAEPRSRKTPVCANIMLASPHKNLQFYFFDFLIWCEKNQITSPLRNLKIWYFFYQFLSNRYVTYSSNSYVHACYSALQMTDIGR